MRFCFFFQAEDGIRDLTVTGVQTCALPILGRAMASDLASPSKNNDLFGVAPSPVSGLKIGMYGEIKFGSSQNPAANGQWQNGFDMGRVVLLPTYQVTDNIVFNAEIEFEHA